MSKTELQEQVKAYNGVISYLKRFEIPELTDQRSVNTLMQRFARDMSLEHKFDMESKMSNLKNAIPIQEDWKLFRTWLNSHYKQR